MESIGKHLQETRERLGISIEEAEKTLRIRAHHLEAIERGDFDALPSSVQAHGFLRNYAKFLGLEEDAILLEYAGKLQNRVSRKDNGSFQEPRTRPSVEVQTRRSQWLSSDVLVAGVITIAILAVLIWGGSRIMSTLRNNPGIDDVESDFLLPTLTPETDSEVTPTPFPPASTSAELVVIEPTETQFIPIAPASQINLRLEIGVRVWLRVTVDGEGEFQGRLLPGSSMEFVANERIEISTGNAAAVRVIFNGQDQGLLGELGQVMIRIWTLEGPITPTPTQTGTPTLTPTATITPTITLTPFFTPFTPTPGNGG